MTALFDPDNTMELELNGINTGNTGEGVIDTVHINKHFRLNHTDFQMIPALGLIWSHCVTSRIVLYKCTMGVRVGQSGVGMDMNASGNSGGQEGGAVSSNKSIRVLSLELSPVYPCNYCYYVITEGGISTAEDD